MNTLYTLATGKDRLGQYLDDVESFTLEKDGKDYVYLDVYNGVIIAAGYVGKTKNHCYFDDEPNWARAARVLRRFRRMDPEQFSKIKELLDRDSKEWKMMCAAVEKAAK